MAAATQMATTGGGTRFSSERMVWFMLALLLSNDCKMAWKIEAARLQDYRSLQRRVAGMAARLDMAGSQANAMRSTRA